jgi:putative aminopeptidase FrvX
MRSWTTRLAALLALAAPATARGQGLDSLVARIGAMSAVTGLEDAMADSLRALLPGAHLDRAGNVVLVRGQGAPVRLAACPLDEIGYVVGGIRDDGYLTLRRVGATPMGPLYDQALEGHRVWVFGRRGPVAGAVAVPSTHLQRGRAAGDEPFTLDQAFVDIGATDSAEVAALGIDALAPVTRAREVHRYGTDRALAAAPWIAQRAACAALVSAARRADAPAGTAVIAFVRRRHFAHDGMGFLLWEHPTADPVLLGGTATTALGSGPVAGADSVLSAGAYRRVTTLGLPARYARTPVETVGTSDIAQLEQWLVAWLGGGR